MNKNIEILYIRTQDGLRLHGNHYMPERKETCVLFVHGMSGNSIENYFAHVLGQALQDEGIGFMYGHNRGYNHINDIATDEVKKEGGFKTVRIGATYERFSDCLHDIDGWVKECQRSGYGRIVLMGHSLGCNKAIHYLSKNKQAIIKGLILASPPDMVGLFKLQKYQPNYPELLEEAKQNIEAGNPRELLRSMVWDWYHLSAQTFMDLAVDGCPADNLPVLRDPEIFPELATIDIPILGLMGELDDIEIHKLEDDLNVIKSKAISCPSFVTNIIPRATHTYDQVEKELAAVVIGWIKKLG